MKRSGIMPAIGFLLLVSCFALTSALADTIYKWTDSQGTVHFGERPPEGVDAELVSINTRSEASATDPYAASRENLRTPAEAKEQRLEAAQQRELEEQDAARMAAACDAQKSRLEELIPHSRVLLQNPDGTTKMMTNEERQNMIDESQAFIDENCN